MPTEKEIKTQYKALHRSLSDSYYSGQSGLTKEQFDAQHGQIWADMETELRAIGALPPLRPDLKTLWQLAATDAEKLAVLAKALGLEK